MEEGRRHLLENWCVCGPLIRTFFLSQGQLLAQERLRGEVTRGAGAQWCRYAAGLGLASSRVAGNLCQQEERTQELEPRVDSLLGCCGNPDSKSVSGGRVYALHHYTLIQSDKIHLVWRYKRFGSWSQRRRDSQSLFHVC